MAKTSGDVNSLRAANKNLVQVCREALVGLCQLDSDMGWLGQKLRTAIRTKGKGQ